MSGGEISGNTSTGGGGRGLSASNFRITNGTIYVSNAADGLKNIASLYCN